MELRRRRWLVLIASCFVTFCAGSVYAWSAFASPMSVYLTECMGREVTDLAFIFTLATGLGPITMISGGYVTDRLGPKGVLLAGGVLFGIGMIGSAFVKSVGLLAVTYGVGMGLGVGMLYGSTAVNAVRFFPEKSGFASGVVAASYGAGSIVLPPIANAVAERWHVTTAFWVIGLVMTVIICGAALLVTGCPDDFRVEGAKIRSEAVFARDHGWREMLRTGDFYLMFLNLTCGAFSGIMIIPQVSQIAQQMMGMRQAAAAVVVSVIALFNALGRLACGALSDRIGPAGTLRITFGVSLAANVVLFFCRESSLVLFLICLAVIGFSFGSIMGIYPSYTARRFGRKNNGVNYGIMFIGFAVAGFLGPVVMRTIVGATGRHQPAFLVSAALAAAGELLIVFLRRNERKRRIR